LNKDRDPDYDPPRRGFLLRFVTVVVGGLLALVPSAIAGVFLCNPILRRRNSEEHDLEGGFLPLAISPSGVPADGTPVRVTVVTDRRDAWNVYPQQRIGNIWLRKEEGGALIAYSTICPHLGCAVEYRTANLDFHCPCHNSQFTLAGQPTNKIPPRPLDELATKVVDGRVWVQYEKFRGGIKEKVPV
jgi:Rieske Fe-S protein